MWIWYRYFPNFGKSRFREFLFKSSLLVAVNTCLIDDRHQLILAESCCFLMFVHNVFSYRYHYNFGYRYRLHYHHVRYLHSSNRKSHRVSTATVVFAPRSTFGGTCSSAFSLRRIWKIGLLYSLADFVWNSWFFFNFLTGTDPGAWPGTYDQTCRC